MKAVDLFAGWGGFTLGAEMAGVDVVWAANHWPIAVETHAANHPHVEHACQDLRQADWTSLPSFDLLLASPACQGHSQASQPRRRRYHDAMRATAWAVVDCVEVTRPRVFVVENVLDFRRWALFDLWCEALRLLGYELTIFDALASRHEVPQRRLRLFLVGALGRRIPPLAPRFRGEPPFGPCLEQDAGGWRPVGLAKPGARERIHAGRRLGRRYLVQHVTGHRGVGLDEPIRTITTKDQWIVVDGDRYRPLTLREYARAMSFPDSYSWPAKAPRADVVKGLGNAVPPLLARDVVAHVMEAS